MRAPPRIHLRAPRVEDAPTLAAIADDPELYATLRDTFPHPYTVDDGLRFVETVQAKAPPQTDFLIEVDGVVVGTVSVFVGEDVYRFNGELGYWIGRRYWNRGYATAAVAQVTEYAFGTLGLGRVYAEVFDTNPASRRVLERCGYRLEYELDEVVVKRGELLGVQCFGRRSSAPPPRG